MEQGRGDGAELEGPATSELKNLLQPAGRAKRLADMAKKHKAAAAEDGSNAATASSSPTDEKHHGDEGQAGKSKKHAGKAGHAHAKAKAKRKTKLGLSHQGPKGPALASRHELINEGPFPLEQRIAELSGHAYYLWGDAKYLAQKSEGTSVESLGRMIESFARQADSSARHLAENNHIPMSTVAPKLPLAVSAMPQTLLFCSPFEFVQKADEAKRMARDFL